MPSMKTNISSYFLGLKKNIVFSFHTVFEGNEFYTVVQKVLLNKT